MYTLQWKNVLLFNCRLQTVIQLKVEGKKLNENNETNLKTETLNIFGDRVELATV
jgi:hypothetical protein